MNVRLENIHSETLPSYVSFLNKPSRSRSDRDSIHSVSSVRSVISNISAAWSSLGWPYSKDTSASKAEKARIATESDLKYLYSAFTKIPCLRLAPDSRAPLIRGYEEFPFDTAVPLHVFKNLTSLEVVDIDFRSLFGWDRLADQLRTLTIRRANIEDPTDLFLGIVLDDTDKRRRRSSKTTRSSSVFAPDGKLTTASHRSTIPTSISVPGSPVADAPLGGGSSTSPHAAPPIVRIQSEGAKAVPRNGSSSPTRPSSSKQSGHHRHIRGPSRIHRTGSSSSQSSDNYHYCYGGRRSSTPNLLSDYLPPSKWRFLQHLGLPDNSLTSVSASSLAPVADTLQSIDLSTNLFNEVPDSLSSLVALRAVNLSNCMIESLHSLSRNPLPAITALNLRGNRLRSLAGIERLPSLERLDLRNNNLTDPTELARLTSLPEIREIWISGNPFVKTHHGYRVVIFNLFRRTPGYPQDVIIDGSGPGYTERKQLVDRAMEPEGAPVIRPSFSDVPTVVNNNSKSAGATSTAATVTSVATTTTTNSSVDPKQEEEHGFNVPPSGPLVQLHRPKKVRRRRIAGSSVDNRLVPGAPENPVTSTESVGEVPHLPPLQRQPLAIPVSNNQGKLDFDNPQTGLLCNSPMSAKLYKIASLSGQQQVEQDPFFQSIPRRNIDVEVDGDIYRRKLEALRQEVGTGWFTKLGNQSWENAPNDITLHCSSSTLAPSIEANGLSGPSNHVIVGSGAV